MHLVNISVKLIGKIEITERFKWENEMFDLAIIVNQIRKLIFFSHFSLKKIFWLLIPMSEKLFKNAIQEGSKKAHDKIIEAERAAKLKAEAERKAEEELEQNARLEKKAKDYKFAAGCAIKMFAQFRKHSFHFEWYMQYCNRWGYHLINTKIIWYLCTWASSRGWSQNFNTIGGQALPDKDVYRCRSQQKRN